MKKQIEDMKTRMEKLEEERDAEIKKNVQCLSENVTNLKLVQTLQSNQSKMTSDLENCKTTDADLLISEQELKECNEEMEAEMEKNFQYESKMKTYENEIVSRNQTILELKSKTAEIESHLQETKAEVEDLRMKLEAVQDERDTETEKGVQCQSENVKNLKLIQELKTTESKLTSELEDCKTTDADLVISNHELKECNAELDSELTKNLQCESEKKTCEVEIISKNDKILELRSKNVKVTSELESGTAKHIIAKKELHDCEEELEDEIQKNKNLQIQNSKSLKELEESRSSASTNRKQAQGSK